MILHHGCSHIRISPDRSLFAAPRSFSQLVTSFIGSQCQGILHMLFLAWTTFVYWSQYTRFSSMLELLCIILAVLFGKIVSFTLFYGKTWFRISRLILFPFTFVCHVCHTNSFELIWIHLIRFSMNIRLTSSLSFTVTWIYIQIPVKPNDLIPYVFRS